MKKIIFMISCCLITLNAIEHKIYTEFGTAVDGKIKWIAQSTKLKKPIRYDSERINGSFVKIGIGKFDEIRHEFIYSQIKSVNNEPAKSIWYNGVLTTKKWRIKNFIPYWSMGIGYGYQNVSEGDRKYVNKNFLEFYSLGVGVGYYIWLNDHFEMKLGAKGEEYYCKPIKYEDESTSANIHLSSEITYFDIGLVYRF